MESRRAQGVDRFLDALGRFDPEEVARLFDVPAHMVTSDLSPGYWERELARQIRRRSLRARLRRLAAK